jgi:hypothetical protein
LAQSPAFVKARGRLPLRPLENRRNRRILRVLSIKV